MALIAPIEFRNRLGPFPTDDSWLEAGMSTLFHLRDVFYLKPDDVVLDLASGCGRVALPLMMYLNPNDGGRYYGLDAAKDMIYWCNENLYRRHFMEFAWADVMNTEYFRQGEGSDSEYKFPYPDQTFSFVFACSLFTHMLTAGLKNYFKEVARTMCWNASFMVSVFVADEQTHRNMEEKTGIFDFLHHHDKFCRVQIKERPEATVLYDFDEIVSIARSCGLDMKKFVRGTWSEKKVGWTQDEILFVKCYDDAKL